MIEWLLALKMWQLFLLFWGFGTFYMILMILFHLTPEKRRLHTDYNFDGLPTPFLLSQDLGSQIRLGINSGKTISALILLILFGWIGTFLAIFELLLFTAMTILLALALILILIMGVITVIDSLRKILRKSVRTTTPA